MVVVAILYIGQSENMAALEGMLILIGFLTTFTLLARDSFTLTEMSWILVKVFFGSSYLGFVHFLQSHSLLLLTVS